MSQIKADQIVQDDEGFMWFGTRYGLVRYDGYVFKVFVRQPNKPTSLDAVTVDALFKDRDGALWVVSAQSVNKFDRTTEVFERYPIASANYITQDSAGILWLTARRGLYSLDPASKRIRHYSHDPNNSSSVNNNLSYCGEDRNGAFWVAGNGYLDEFDRKAGKVVRRVPLPGASHEFRFHEDRLGTFWIYHSSPNALAVFDRQTNVLTHYAFPERDPTVMRVSAIVEDRNGALWIATHGFGLLKLDRARGELIRYSNVPGELDSLPQNRIDGLFEDREGNVWVAPGDLGPAYLPSEPPAFKKLLKVPGTFLEPFVGALYEDRQRILWIGTPEALNRVDRKAGDVTAYRTGGSGIGADVISLAEDRSGNLWVGTYSHGLHCFDRRTGKFKTYLHNPSDPHSLSDNFVRRLLVDRHGTLWAGTRDGLNRFDAVTGRFKTYKLGSKNSLEALAIVEDRNGGLWIGAEYSGLHYFDPATGEFDRKGQFPGMLSDIRVNSVHFDRSGAMWIGTQNGLDRLDPQTGTISVFMQRDGLPGNAVGCILEDKKGNLWMSTNNGVARFNPERKTFANFSTADGLPGPNLTGWGACFQSPSGEMFFGGFNGGVSFFPEKVMEFSDAPPIVLTDFRLAGNPVEIGGDSPLRNSISYTKVLTLRHEQNVVSIGFAALSYASPATNRYRYRLEGLEPNWNEVGSDRRLATYTTLPAGTYTFRVQGATRGGPWSEPGVTLRIEMLPPWWSTWPFQSAIGALLLLLAWAAYRQRVHQVAQQFEVRLAERTRIARELHDTLLQSFQASLLQMQSARNLLSRRPEQAVQNLDDAIAMAAGAIVEGRDEIQNLRSQPASQGDLAQLLTVTGQDLIRSHGLKEQSATFRVIVEGERQDLEPLLQDEIYRMVREVLRNAFQHAGAKQIEAEIRYEHRMLRVCVRDDGKGITPEILKAGGRDGHWGLAGLRERANRIGADLGFWSEAGAGTEVQLTVPSSIAYRGRESSRRFKLFRRRRAKA